MYYAAHASALAHAHSTEQGSGRTLAVVGSENPSKPWRRSLTHCWAARSSIVEQSGVAAAASAARAQDPSEREAESAALPRSLLAPAPPAWPRCSPHPLQHMSETLVGAIATKVSRALNLSKPNAQLARELIREATKAKDFADFAVWASQYNVTNDTLQRQIYHQVKATEAAARDEQHRLQAGIKLEHAANVEVPPVLALLLIAPYRIDILYVISHYNYLQICSGVSLWNSTALSTFSLSTLIPVVSVNFHFSLEFRFVRWFQVI